MASDLNRVVLIGRLTRDPELKHIPSGTAIANFSIANNRTYSSSGEKTEQVSFFNCIAWAKTGEVIVEYCKKGQRIAIEGRLQQRGWEDKNGQKRSTVEIVVENFQFLTAKGGSAQTETENFSEKSNPSSNVNFTNDDFSDDDIPF